MKIVAVILLLVTQSFLFAAKPYPLAGQPYVEGPYEKACAAFEAKDWQGTAERLAIFLRKYPNHSMATEAKFLLGVAYYQLKEYELSNTVFSDYLKENVAPLHFEEAIKYKFCIAQQFQKGECKRLFGLKFFPKWICCEQEAVEIYDEIASVYPHDDMAAHALYNKGCMMVKRGSFKEAIQEYQSVIRRFPRTEIAAKSYEGIALCYLREAMLEPNNPDFLSLSMVNLKKYKLAFPGDDRVSKLEEYFADMQEVYACGYFNMGCFYERTERKRAAWIYYMTTIKEFPSTRFAFIASDRLKILCLPEA